MKERDALLDQMIFFAMEGLLSGDEDRRNGLVRALADRWPTQTAIALVHAITAATQGIEDSFRESAIPDPVVPLGYRIAALAAADIHALEAMGLRPAKAEDLLHFWRRTDPSYLRLQR